jgi:hypothetical protein
MPRRLWCRSPLWPRHPLRPLQMRPQPLCLSPLQAALWYVLAPRRQMVCCLLGWGAQASASVSTRVLTSL